MADMYLGEGSPMAGAGFRGGLKTPVNLIGAAVSVALIVGLSVWSYQLAVRDVSGVPVIRALEGPMRVRPEDPGGQPAEHQGLAVNQIPAEGMAGPAPDRLILAPPPIEIAEEDVLPVKEPAAPVPTASATDLAVAAALAEIELEGVEPLSGFEDTTEDSAIPENVIPANLGGVVRSPRPEPRPEGVEVASLDPTGPGLSDRAAARDVDPATIAQGTRLVQLGAYDSREEALENWAKYAGPFAEYFDGRGRVIQEATSGGRTFYRLRVEGFTDLADARRFCSVLLAEDAPCIPVVAR